MVHLKIILDTRRKKSDGTYPVVYRVTDVKKVMVLQSGISISKEHWNDNERSISEQHPNFQHLNASLSKKYYEVQRAIVRLEDDDSFSFDSLKEALQGKPRQISTSITFHSFSMELINQMLEEQRTGNAIVYRTAVNRLIDHCKNPGIKFRQIDYPFLEGFKRRLMKDGVKTNTVGNYFRSIRAIYNKAIKSKVVDRSFYPFGDISIRTEKTAKRAITIDDIVNVSRLPLKAHSREWHARNYFLLSFSLIGISFTDMAYLKTSDVVKGRVLYRRRKTHKEYSIKLTPLAQNILAYYKGRRAAYLLPVLPDNVIENSLEAKNLIAQWIKTTNKWLKREGSKIGIDLLTTYVARHTWATTAKRMGYSNELIAEAMGHEYGNRITNIYLDCFEQSVIDDLNERVQSSL